MDFLNRLIADLVGGNHPIHTMFVHFPIALTGAALFFILLALWRRSRLLEQVAFADLALAVVSTLAAGITGYYDNLVNYNGIAPNAPVKIALAITLFLVAGTTTLLRWRDPALFDKMPARVYYVAAYFVSFALAGTLGFLGGIILYGF